MPNRTNAAPGRRALNRINRVLALAALALCALTASAQDVTNTLNLIPNTTGTAVGTANFYDINEVYALTVEAPSTIGANHTLILPIPTGSAGCVQDSTGAGALIISSCLGVPPITLSGTISSPILTVTQSGSGDALDVTGSVSLTGGALTVTENASFGTGHATTFYGTTYLEGAHNYVYSGANVEILSGGSLTGDSGSTANFDGTINFNSVSGTFSGTHIQNLGTLDSVSFGAVTASGNIESTSGTIAVDGGLYTWNSSGVLAVNSITVGGGSDGISSGGVGTFSNGSYSGTLTTNGTVDFKGTTDEFFTGATIKFDSGTTIAFGGTAAIDNTATLTVNSGGTLALNGTINGTHGQPIGTGDAPTFAGLTVSSGNNLLIGSFEFNGTYTSGSSATPSSYNDYVPIYTSGGSYIGKILVY